MDLPIEVIEAVKATAEPPKAEPKKRAPHKRNLQKRVLHAVTNGLRTAESIANALNITQKAASASLYILCQKEKVYSLKKEGSNILRYYSVSDKPVLGTTDLTKKKARKPYTKRVVKVAEPEIRRATKEEVQLMQDKERLAQRISSLELTLVEKEKEVWTLECEVFDKKAVIKYLEEKLFVLGVK
jgi:hypothetical protein